MSDITKRADVSKGAVYHHFPHKAAIATAILEQDHQSLIKMLNSITHNDPVQRINSIFNSFQELASQDGEFLGNAVIAFNWEFAMEQTDLAHSARICFAELGSHFDHIGLSSSKLKSALIGAYGMARLGSIESFQTAAEGIIAVIPGS